MILQLARKGLTSDGLRLRGSPWRSQGVPQLLVRSLAFVVALVLPTAASAVPPRTLDAAGLRLRLPHGWQPRDSTSPMRAAELVVPAPAGNSGGEAGRSARSGEAELVVFHFGPGQGGDFEANAARWLGQLERDPGTEPERGELASVGELRIRWIEAAGTLLPSRMGPGPKERQPGSRLVGAMLEGTGGPWFLKLTGPGATVAAVRDDFRMMLRSAETTGLLAPPLPAAAGPDNPREPAAPPASRH